MSAEAVQFSLNLINSTILHTYAKAPGVHASRLGNCSELVSVYGEKRYIGAFLGFLLALYLQHLNEKRHQKNIVSLLIKNVTDELTDIQSSLLQYINMNEPLKVKIQTPCWEAVLGSGKLLDLIDTPVYLPLIRVYSLIKNFNEERIDLGSDKNIKALKAIANASKDITKE